MDGNGNSNRKLRTQGPLKRPPDRGWPADVIRRTAAGRWALTGVRLGLLVAAALCVVRLAAAEIEFRRDTPAAVRRAAEIGDSAYWERLAELAPESATSALRQAVRADPRSAALWIELGLSEEHLRVEHRSVEHLTVEQGTENALARAAFEAAFRVDRQYTPAWALANFCFRRADQECFWRAARRAADRSPALEAGNLTDVSPLLDLAERMEESPVAMLERLTIGERVVARGATASRGALLEKAYLNDLIGRSRWQDAVLVARRVAAHHDSTDSARLDDFVNRLIGAGRADAAVVVWNDYAGFTALEPARGVSLTNGDLARAPRETGFDWRIGLPAPRVGPHAYGSEQGLGPPASGGIEPQWTPGVLAFRFAGEAEQSRFAGDETGEHLLAEQWLPVRAGSFRLRFEYSTGDLPAPTGIRWEFSARGGPTETREEAPPLAPSAAWRAGQWKFSADGPSVALLRLLYRREPGTERARGVLSIRRVRLETL